MAAILLSASGIILFFQSRSEVIDDAFISFRYCRNFLAGNGLVFNIGERVEGYTNFLWVLLLSGAGALGIDLVVASQFLGAGFALATLFLLFRFPTSDRTWWSAAVAPALCAFNAVFCLWSIHGLETTMFGFCLLAAVYADLQQSTRDRFTPWGPLLYALATLTRPEGFFLYFASLAYWLFFSPKEISFPLRARRAVLSAALYAVIIGGHLLWRHAYYGDWLPNTFYAKSGFSALVLMRGFRYLARFFSPVPSLLFLLLIPAAISAIHDRSVRFILWMVCAALGLVVMEGGDAFPGFRFIAPVLPLLYLLVQEGLRRLVPLLKQKTALIVLLGVLALTTTLHLRHMFLEAERESAGSTVFTGTMKLAADALKTQFPPDTRIALNAIGAIPFYTGFYTVDMLGLTDKHIARTAAIDPGRGLAGHEKGDGRYVLSRKPDIILMGNMIVLPFKPAAGQPVRMPAVEKSETEMIQDPEMRLHYAPDFIRVKDGRYLWILKRK